MQYRVLGRTGWRVSVLGFGAAALGHVYGPVAQDEATRTVRAALDAGVNFLDVSPYYGDTAAERALGVALRDVPREAYYLSTKCGRYGPQDFDFSPARLRRSLDESRRRLGLDHIDLYLLHDVEFGDLDRILDESVPELLRLRDQGAVRAVGITGFPLTIFRRALDAGLDAILSYGHYGLLDRSLETLLPDLAARGIGVINASPTGMGLLTAQGPQDWHPAPDDLRAACRTAAELCARRGADLAELALQCACDHPGIAVTLSGAASQSEIERNAAALQRPLDRELLAEVLAVLAPCRGRLWPSGRPENNP